MTPDELVATWRQTAQQQFDRAGFAEVLDQRRELEIPFVVHLVAAGDGVLAPWIPQVAAFLQGFGFEVLVHDETTADALLALRRETPDILLVWCTSNDLQTFCTAFAAERSATSHLLVCVPDGHDGMLYCRLLREQHGIETISLPVQRLQNGDSCRFGLDVLRRCSDHMFDKVAISRREARIKNTYVLLVHGIRTRALWQGPIRAALEDAGLIAWPTNYDKFDVVQFLLPFERFKQRAIDRVKNEIDTLRNDAPAAEIGVVAHSFGSYIVGQILRSGHKFRTVALCGSVLPAGFDFTNGRGAMVVNEVGRSDVWPVLADRLAWAYGATGTFGFNSGSVIDRVHASFHHSSSLKGEFCSKFWVPLFCDQRVESTDEENAQPSWLVRILDKMPLLGPLFWIIVVGMLSIMTYLLIIEAARIFSSVLSRVV